MYASSDSEAVLNYYSLFKHYFSNFLVLSRRVSISRFKASSFLWVVITTSSLLFISSINFIKNLLLRSDLSQQRLEYWQAWSLTPQGLLLPFPKFSINWCFPKGFLVVFHFISLAYFYPIWDFWSNLRIFYFARLSAIIFCQLFVSRVYLLAWS